MVVSLLMIGCCISAETISLSFFFFWLSWVIRPDFMTCLTGFELNYNFVQILTDFLEF